MTGRLRLVAWLLALAAALAGLHALGQGTLAAPPLVDGGGALEQWLDSRGPAVAAFAIVRLVTLGLGWYLLVTTVLATLLRLARATRGATVVEALALPSVRRLVHAAVGVGLAAAAVTTTAGTVAGGRPALAGETSGAGAATDADTVTMRRLPHPAPAPTSPAPAPAPPPSPAPAPAPPATTWTVRPGDHFWRIAEEVLTAAWHRPPTDDEVTPYWARLIEHNRSKLANPDDPDLVFPGQQIDLLPPPNPF